MELTNTHPHPYTSQHTFDLASTDEQEQNQNEATGSPVNTSDPLQSQLSPGKRGASHFLYISKIAMQMLCLKPGSHNCDFQIFLDTESQSLTQHEDTQNDQQSEGEASKSPPILFHEASAMPPPPQDSPQTELAPRKRRRKRDDPQNCLTNSEVSGCAHPYSHLKYVDEAFERDATMPFLGIKQTQIAKSFEKCSASIWLLTREHIILIKL